MRTGKKELAQISDGTEKKIKPAKFAVEGEILQKPSGEDQQKWLESMYATFGTTDIEALDLFAGQIQNVSGSGQGIESGYAAAVGYQAGKRGGNDAGRADGRYPRHVYGDDAPGHASCQAPYDNIPERSWPLFRARERISEILSEHKHPGLSS